VFGGADVLLLTIFLDSASPFFQSRDVEVLCSFTSLFRGFAVCVILSCVLAISGRLCDARLSSVVRDMIFFESRVCDCEMVLCCLAWFMRLCLRCCCFQFVLFVMC
jgi:hypothetical protein